MGRRGTREEPAEKVVKDIRRRTRKHHSADEKTRIVVEGRRGAGQRILANTTWIH